MRYVKVGNAFLPQYLIFVDLLYIICIVECKALSYQPYLYLTTIPSLFIGRIMLFDEMS